MLLSSDAKRAVLRQEAQTGQTQEGSGAQCRLAQLRNSWLFARASLTVQLQHILHEIRKVSTLLQVDSAAAATVLLVPLSQTLNVCSTFTSGE